MINNSKTKRGKYIRTKEIKQKTSKSNLGRRLSEDTKIKMCGRTPWNKGKKPSVERIIKQKENAKTNDNYGMRNKHHSEETKEKIKNSWNTQEKRIFAKERRSKQILPIKDTSIEIKIQNFLKQLRIEFFTHQYMTIEHGYQCDILIPSMNLVIECDGDYWHGNPILYPNPTTLQQEQINEDKIRTIELIAKGFKVLRLWEFEINDMTIEQFKNRFLARI